jgi:biopolymer transport protein ExbD
MPSVKIPRKSTVTDMTPFVDVAFLILSFFIMATKFKPPEPVEITTPTSVSSSKLNEQDAVKIEIDKTGRVFFSVNTKNPSDWETKKAVITSVNQNRNLGLTDAEINAFEKNTVVGVPFAKLKSYLLLNEGQRAKAADGVPVSDSVNNELAVWIGAAQVAFQGRPLNYMIKGDNNSKYPAFKGVIDALRKNDLNKYQLITDPEGVPAGTDLYKLQESGKYKSDD